MARCRTLRPEEEEIWQAVARTAKPMHVAVQHRKPVADATPPAPRADAPHASAHARDTACCRRTAPPGTQGGGVQQHG